MGVIIQNIEIFRIKNIEIFRILTRGTPQCLTLTVWLTCVSYPDIGTMHCRVQSALRGVITDGGGWLCLSIHLILSYKSVCFSSLGSYLPVRETNNSYTNMRNYRLLTTEESEFLSARSPSGRAETESLKSVCGWYVCPLLSPHPPPVLPV